MNTDTVPVQEFIPTLVIERDDGRFQIGFSDDAAGPFESRRFAESVATKEGQRHALATA
jgi:hypothetical protein